LVIAHRRRSATSRRSTQPELPVRHPGRSSMRLWISLTACASSVPRTGPRTAVGLMAERSSPRPSARMKSQAACRNLASGRTERHHLAWRRCPRGCRMRPIARSDFGTGIPRMSRRSASERTRRGRRAPDHEDRSSRDGTREGSGDQPVRNLVLGAR
jgi:hypothetical protein